MKTTTLLINLVVGLTFAVLTFAFWAITNQPSTEPPWPSSVAGMSFSPLRLGHDPAANVYPSLEEIEADLSLLAGQVHSIRTYGVGGTLGEIPTLAKKYHMTVTLGAWLTGDPVGNELEVDKLIAVCKARPETIKRVIIGNETILRGELTAEQLTDYIDRVRSKIKAPVSTGEPWNVWVAHPELAGHTDFIASHFLPYWEGIDLDRAVGHVQACFQMLQEKFPGKPVLMAEVGWPSNGRTRGNAVASEANEAIFLRRFLAQAQTNHYDYYLMEAFDQPWKKESEGSVGAYWGVFDVFRNQKFAFTEPIVRMPHWRLLAVGSIAIAMLTFLVMLFDSQTLQNRGKSFLAALANGFGISLVWIGYDYLNQYLTPATVIIGVILALGFFGINLVILIEAHEWVEASWVNKRRRFFTRLNGTAEAEPVRLPKVSIHVPAHNEPPEMVKATLNCLAQLDYPDFEVLLIDNNTRNGDMWQPVADHCRLLGERFRFFHVDPLRGYKAGALNFALANMAPDADVVAVIDSDYQVKPSWLKDLVPILNKPGIGFVQAPQDYRDGNENIFKTMCYAEYQGFFHIGMVTRNDRNAIIEHGTMTMIRGNVLREVGGWGEWCITEDAELGLRIMEHGYEGAYVTESYGKGLIPDTYMDYKKQRYRWAYGAVQILKRHRQALFTKATKLSIGQRYHFLAGWLPWLSDSMNLFYTLAAIVWSIAMMINPRQVDPPLVIFMVPPVALFCFKVFKLVYLYRTQVKSTRRQTIAAAIAGLALSHTIAKAFLTGLFSSDRPFFRTPKCEDRPPVIRALSAAVEEAGIAVSLWLAAIGVLLAQGTDILGTVLWAGALLIQSLPYTAAIIVSLTNAMPGSSTGVFQPTASPIPVTH